MSRRRSIIGGTLVALVLGVAAGVAVAGGSQDSSADPAARVAAGMIGGAAARPAVTDQGVTLAKAAGKQFLDDFVTGDGRVVRKDQGGDTVSEGQAYGLLIAVAIGDQKRFNLIWSWTQHNLQRSDQLLASQWQNGKVVDGLPATDADLDTARALLIAAQRWNVPQDKTDALAIGNSILLRETVDVVNRKVLVAGPWARKSPAVINPSYFSPRAFDALHAATGDRRWTELQDTSLEAIDGLTRLAPSLPPDWARLEGTQIVPSTQQSDPSKGVRYGYEAARVLPRYAEMCGASSPDPDATAPAIGRRLVARTWSFLKAQGAAGPTIEYRPDGRRIGGNTHPLALVAAAAAADSAGDEAARDHLLDEADTLRDQATNYYGSAWVALGRIMLTTNLLGSCGSEGAIA